MEVNPSNSNEVPSLSRDSGGTRASRSTSSSSWLPSSGMITSLQSTSPTISPTDHSTFMTEFDQVVSAIENEEANDADGNDSDIEGTEVELFDEAYVKALIERNNDDGGIHVEEINNGNIAFVISEDDVLDDNHEVDLLSKVAKIPENWYPGTKKAINEPDFNQVDNPGNWNKFIFRPLFKKEGRGNTSRYDYV